MKVPYSYRQQFFVPALIASFLGHAVAFATGAGPLSFSPEYGVEQAPLSIEVVISKPAPEKEEKQVPSQILTALQPSKETVPVKKEEKRKEVKPKPSKPLYIPPQRGAVRRTVSPYLKNPAPVYPHRARERGWEGLVKLSVFVRSDGKPEQIEIEKSSGYNILDDAAVHAVKKWKFKPAGIGDVSFSTWVHIPIRFILVEER
ncbi:MAG: hypothetical protein A3G87_07410 [Omnitrophica bacterium RIFCSPLOWO2_12_FULL_50_11]|nr:MAG: hypothetical protein A3G87_07410 [Omnitrophica bacterium RIFCSPLOWO2_12_FULL_50_11]